MRLLIKFNLVLILVFGSGVGIAGYLSHQFLEHSARKQVLEQARLMMGAAGGMRTYTSKQVGPLLKAHQLRINRFLPQTVPAYSANEVFTYLRTTYPDYSYKEASLNPTNLRNRAVDWETDVIQIFRNHPDMKEFSAERETPGGRVLFLAKPLLVDMPCLQCHSTPDKAPEAMIKVYGGDHGFGWNVGEPIAAQIVSVPMTVP
jgi:protein-histidine pros-kinase